MSELVERGRLLNNNAESAGDAPEGRRSGWEWK
jgi:hypothetical protein